MLTKELAIVGYEGGEVRPDRLRRETHAHYVDLARQMLEVYRTGVGQTRRELHDAVKSILGAVDDCPPKRAEAFCKLLDEDRVSRFQHDTTGRAAKLRLRVFRLAAPFHPLVSDRDRLFEQGETEIKDRVAKEIGEPWQAIEERLFADVIEFHRLIEFKGFAEPAELLSRYNVAQLQAALYGAVRMTVWAGADFKTILRYAKLSRLMHRITHEGASGRYKIDFDGPASIMRETQRYGVNMARFIPALLACKDWKMEATISRGRGGWKSHLRLDSGSGYRGGQLEPEDFDSHIEEGFWKKWAGEERDGWRLEREDTILHEGQRVFIPDFSFHHKDGRKILMEIVGFWTPEYIKEKIETMRRFSRHKILLAVAEKLDVPDGLAWPGDVIIFKTALKLNDVLSHLQTQDPAGQS